MLFLRMFLRLSVGFISLLIYMNILGKMQLAPQSALDQIGNYVLGGIIGGIIYNMDLSIWMFFIAILTWGGLMLMVKYIKGRSLNTKRIIEGKPILLMENGVFKTDNFKNYQISADDIIPKLHQLGYKTVSELKTIWLESNGQLTVVKKEDQDLGWILIEDGQVNYIDLDRLDKTSKWLENEVIKKGYEITSVFCAEYIDEDLIIYPYE